MLQAAKAGKAGLSLTGAFVELPYDLGEMSQIDAALSSLGAIGFLESREGTEKWARYGISAARPLLTLTVRRGRCRLEDGLRTVMEGEAGCPLALLREHEPVCRVPEGLESFRYVGGWLGFLGYETSGLFERIPPAARDDMGLPDAQFHLPSIVVLKDAVARRLVLVAWELGGREPHEVLVEAKRLLLASRRTGPPLPDGRPRAAISTFSEAAFLAAVSRARELIDSGEMIQVVLSRRWEVRPSPPPESVYAALSRLNPSPYHFFLRLEGGTLLGASPELLVRREGNTLTVRPIAGTRPRGSSEVQDRSYEVEMLADPKERAEHIMLVDLGRNDLGRVSEPGSVEVTRRMTVERYSHVMHIVSEVRSRLGQGADSYDVVRASFPAGTVSGAPKIRAMQVLAELEPVVRGPYAGGVGYFDVRGNMDFCITIRSVFYSGDRAFVQSGAGIVADSVPERERDEIAAKAKAMFRAFGEVEVEE